MALTQTNSQHANRFLFSLLPYFESQTLDLVNQAYFEYNKTTHFSPRKVIKYPAFHNPYIENELKGYLQHLALNLHLKASAISYQASCVIPRIEFFIATFYPSINSVIEIPYEEIYCRYLDYLSAAGLTLKHDSVKHSMADLSIKRYPAKADIVSGFTRYYKLVYDTSYPDTRNEKDKDIWDIRRLGISYSTAVARPRYRLNFTKIRQDWLREIAKKYCYYRIQNRTMSAVLDDLKGLNPFSEFLYEEHPEISRIDEISRDVIEQYFSFLSLKGFVTTTYNRRVSILRTFFALGYMLDLEGFPAKPLISDQDYRKRPALMPKYYSMTEISRINANLGELPIQIARMLFVLENCGMRLSDICSSTILIDGKKALLVNERSEYVFTYCMPKVHRYNTIPVSQAVGAVLQEAIFNSQTEYGMECKYIFAKSKEYPISVDQFVNSVNNMAAKHHLKKDDGSPLRIRGHAFRTTLATEYANAGISLDAIRMMLGQKSLKVLEHYVSIHDTTMVDAMRPLTEENEQLIHTIGEKRLINQQKPIDTAFLSLSNGKCAKTVETGICKHADFCYSCKMFRPAKECIPIYKMQLYNARANVIIAKMHGYERIIEANNRVINALLCILRELGEPEED